MANAAKHAYVLNVVADDHPGIVAAVGQAVAGAGGNIDACSQTVLEGYFTLIMIVSFPHPVISEELAERVRRHRGEQTGLQVIVRPFEPPPPGRPAGEQLADRFVITAFGRDKPGIVLRFSQYLAGKDINIVDLYGQKKGQDFVLIGQVEVPGRWDLPQFQHDLEELGRAEGYTVRLQHENIFVATNQLRLPR